MFPPLCFNVIPMPDEGTHSPAIEEIEEKDENSHRLTDTDKENAIKGKCYKEACLPFLAGRDAFKAESAALSMSNPYHRGPQVIFKILRILYFSILL